MNGGDELQELRKQLEATERTVHRLKLVVAVFAAALFVVTVALYNSHVRAILGAVLAVAGILFGVLLFFVAVRSLLEWLSPSQQDQNTPAIQVGQQTAADDAAKPSP